MADLKGCEVVSLIKSIQDKQIRIIRDLKEVTKQADCDCQKLVGNIQFSMYKDWEFPNTSSNVINGGEILAPKPSTNIPKQIQKLRDYDGLDKDQFKLAYRNARNDKFIKGEIVTAQFSTYGLDFFPLETTQELGVGNHKVAKGPGGPKASFYMQVFILDDVVLNGDGTLNVGVLYFASWDSSGQSDPLANSRTNVEFNILIKFRNNRFKQKIHIGPSINPGYPQETTYL